MARLRSGFTLANYRDKWAYVCGGASDSEVMRTVERYDFKTGAWEEVVGMSVARKHPSSTCLDSSLYVICGSGYSHSNLNSIDKHTINGAWKPISINDGNTVPRLSPVVSVLNMHTIVILGGFSSKPLECAPIVTLNCNKDNQAGEPAQGQIIAKNTNKSDASKEAPDQYKRLLNFSSLCSNQGVRLHQNKILALVKPKESQEYCFIECTL